MMKQVRDHDTRKYLTVNASRFSVISMLHYRGAAAIADSQRATDQSYSDVVGTTSPGGSQRLGDAVCHYNTGAQTPSMET